MLDKKIIKEKFSAASGAYNQYAGLQKSVATELASRIQTDNPAPASVLDIGAGTGFLASEIKKNISNASITALDIAHGMSIVVKNNFEDCEAVTGDVEALPFSHDVFNVVVSSFSMQWLPHLEVAVNEIFRVLKGNGKLLIAMLGQGSFPELRESHDRFFDKLSYQTLFNQLPCVDGVKDILLRQKFCRVSAAREVRVEEYKNSLTFLKRLKCIGAQNPFSNAGHGKEYGKMKKMLSWYDSNFVVDTGVRATYEILWIEGVK